MPEIFDLALVIPCYNEAKRLPATFAKIVSYFASRPLGDISTVVVFVDDGSADETLSMLCEFAAMTHEGFSVEIVAQGANQGKGAAVKAGFMSVQAQKYGFTDADLSYGLTPVADFVRALDEAPVVIARRADKARDYSKLRRLLSAGFSTVSRLLTGVRASDPQSGFKFFRREVVKRVFPMLTQGRFAFDIECLARIEAARFSVREIPLAFEHDAASTVVASDGLRYVLDLFAIVDLLPFARRRFYGLLFLLALAISLVVYGWLIHYGYFFSDDFTWLWFGQRVLANPSEILTLKAGSFFSPVLNVYYAGMMWLFGTQAPYYLAMNILIHVVAATLGAVFVLDLTKSRLAATLAVILLALSGGAYEPVVWVGANMHSIVTVFIITSLLGFTRFVRGEGWSFSALSIFTMILAFCTKESSIALPPLLIGLYLTLRQQHEIRVPKRQLRIYATAGGVFTGLYAVGQFILQEGGDTFAKSAYVLNWQGIAKIPFAVFDLFVPWKGLFLYVSDTEARFFGLILLLIFAAVFWRHRRVPLVPFATLFMLVGIAPTLFFATLTWWEPLASRYTYLPRVGAVIFIVVVITSYITKNRARRVVHSGAIILAVVSLVQISYMFQMVLTNYTYVYRTGRTLAHAAKLLDEPRTAGVYVQPDHPFRSNNAHLVAALAVYAHLREDQIVFLKENESVPLSNSMMLLYWRPKSQQYELTSHSDIFKRFPLP